MSIPVQNTRPRPTVNSLKNIPIDTLSKTEPFENIDKPDWVATQGTSKGVLVMLAVVYTVVAAFVGYLSFRGASFMFGVPIGIVVAVLTAAAIYMVWYVVLHHKTIPVTWKIGILIFEVIIMGFDIAVSAAGWNISKIGTLAERIALERNDEYVEFHEEAVAFYGYVAASLKEEAARIAKQEELKNGGQGPIYRISDATAKKLAKDSLALPLITTELPVFANSLTLKELNTKLVQYHDVFSAQEAKIQAELGVTRAVLVDQKELVLSQLKKSALNSYQKESVDQLDQALSTSIENADRILAIEILAPEMASKDVQTVSKEGIIFRLLSACGLLFFLGLISILTWPRSKKRGANDPYRWFEAKLIEYQLQQLRIAFGYTEEEALQARFGSTDDELLEILSDQGIRTRIGGQTYRQLRSLYTQLGRTTFIDLFTNGVWTGAEAHELLSDPGYGSMATDIIAKLNPTQFRELKLFRNSAVTDAISRPTEIAGLYAQVIIATKHRLPNAGEREAFVDRFMSLGSQDPEFYQNLLFCIQRFNPRQLSVLSASYVTAIIANSLPEIISIHDSLDGQFTLATGNWTLEDSLVISEMNDRKVFSALAAMIEQGNRINAYLWRDIRQNWQHAVRVAGRGNVTINQHAVTTLAGLDNEVTFRATLPNAFITA